MFNNIADDAGRFLLAALFLNNAISKIRALKSGSVDQPKPLLATSIGMEGLGSLSLITGAYPKVGAALLILYLGAITFIYNNPIKDPTQKMAALKNAAILGGLLHFYSTNTSFSRHGV